MSGEKNEVEFVTPLLPEAKPLGLLIRASAVPNDKKGTMLDIKTEGISLGASIYRLEFPSAKEAQRFASHAEIAERQDLQQWSDRESARAEEKSKLEVGLRKALTSRAPLVYPGQLFGPDLDSQGAEEAEDGAEVLLGDGVFVLLDPPSSERNVGRYELRFYSEDEGPTKSARTLEISHKMVLRQLEREQAELDDNEEPAISLQLTGGGQVHTLAFGDVVQASEFERDFRVRQRVMELASMFVQNDAVAKDALAAQAALESWPRKMLQRAQLALAMPSLVLILALLVPVLRWPTAAMCQMTCDMLG